jgi:hypothetical protein
VDKGVGVVMSRLFTNVYEALNPGEISGEGSAMKATEAKSQQLQHDYK